MTLGSGSENKLLEELGSQIFPICLYLKAICDTVFINCYIIAWIVSDTIFGLSAAGIVTTVLSIVLPIVFILILACLAFKKALDKGHSIIKALCLIFLMLPFITVMTMLWFICVVDLDEGWVFFLTGFFNLMFLLCISVSNLIPGFNSEDTVTFAVSITMVVLLVVAFISFVTLGWKAFWYEDGDRFRRWISVYNVGFLIVIIIATISWMTFKEFAETRAVLNGSETVKG
ncbi:uncharacterized protein [Hemitrygon akajei]|uniref:uncharacterized protein n=1 Tax=Hemitrygon akajei TaxID=2704970 RepID=UPI003BF9B7D0